MARGIVRYAVGTVGAVACGGPCYAALRGFGIGCAPAVVVVAIVMAAAVAVIAPRLPADLDDLARRHRVLAIVWLVLGLAGAANLARVSQFMVDANAPSYAAVPDDDFNAHHNCLTAYFRAATAQRDGVPNVYVDTLYKPTGAAPYPAKIGPFGVDIYEYPPPFLVPARAALAVSDDFVAWRAAWFACEALLLAVSLLVAAWWIGGRDGIVAGLLAPAVLCALPTLVTLQIGNVQLALFAIAVLALVAIERDRPWLGGGLLAALAVMKIFPGLFVVYLAARRRWRAVIAMCVTSVAAVALTFALIGSDAFHAFVTYQLPRMADGSAFPMLHIPGPAAMNHSIFGIVIKLHHLGVPGTSFAVAGIVAWVFTAVAVAIAYVLGRRSGDRLADVLVWLGLLQLAALRSPFTPNVYAVLGPIWMITLLAVRARTIGRAWLAFAWLALGCSALLTPLTPIGVDLKMALASAAQLVGYVVTYQALRASQLPRYVEKPNGESNSGT